MERYKFADLIVGMECTYDYTKKLCEEYKVEHGAPDFTVHVTKEQIQREQGNSEVEYPNGYLESLAVYRQIGEKAVEYGVLLMHASVVAVDGKAYLFTAPSGTGKSTHTSLWKEYFGDRAIMINDDKPLLRFYENEIRVYGTPWDGKHRRSTNTSAVVEAVCVLEQGKKNEIKRLSNQEAYVNLLTQIYRINDSVKMKKVLQLIDRFMKEMPVYKMKCDISKEAVITAYDAMKQGAKEE